MNTARSRSNSGVALIVVLIAMVSLSILAGIFAFRMKVEARLAMNSNNDAEMEWMGRSGAEAAKWLLAQEMQARCPDSLQSIWAGGPGSRCPGVSNSPIADIRLPWTIPLGNGEVTIQPMIDQERKANINVANERMLEQALVLMGVDAGEYPVIVNSILDWVDPDDADRPQGAESDYYMAGAWPYPAKNGPIDDMSELQLVQGMTPDLYWGPKAENYVPSRLQNDSNQRLGFNADVPTYPVGFVDLFTPISAGRININTASEVVLQLLPGVDEHAASEIIRLRNGYDAGFGVEEGVPFNNPGEIINAGLNPALVQQIIPYCDVRSATFEVPITAKIGNYTRKFRAVLVRVNMRDVRVVSFAPEEN